MASITLSSAEDHVLASLLRQRYTEKGFTSKDDINKQKKLMDAITYPKVFEYLKAKQQDVVEFKLIGSIYDGTGIAGSNEYDILAILGGNTEVRVSDFSHGYADIATSPAGRSDWTTASPKKLIQQFISHLQKCQNILMKDPDFNSGNLEMKVSLEKASVCVEINYESVIVRHKITPSYKTKQSELFVPSSDASKPEQWMQIFPEREKDELTKSGCLKTCFRLLKIMRKDEASLQKLSSYHLKTVVIHEARKNDLSWAEKNLAQRWKGLILSLIVVLEQKQLPHAYLGGVNTLTGFQESTLTNMVNRLKAIMKKDSSKLGPSKRASASSQGSCSAKNKNGETLLPLLRKFYKGKVPAPSEIAEGQKQLMKQVKDKIQECLKGEKLVQEFRYTGSAYEGVNLKTSSDYDIMILINGTKGKVKVDDSIPGYARLSTKDMSLQEMCTKDGHLIPAKVISYFVSRIKKATDFLLESPEHAQSGLKIVPREHGPAIEVDIERGKDTLSLDFAPCFMIDEDTRYIAKTFKGDSSVLGERDPKMLWRQSFSFEEVKLLRKADADNGCRKMILRIVKAMRKSEKDTTLQKISSYHLKTLLLRQIEDARVDWSEPKLADRWRDYMSALAKTFSEGFIEHYFIKEFNLYNGIKKETLENMKNRVERILSSEKEQQKAFAID